jgi:uncharacterized membrane protein YgcG
MNNIYDILENCLQEVENGVELETVLARHPEQAEELRPILEASINAKRMAVPMPSADVVRRNRAKLLQHAAQLREAQPVGTNRWSMFFQRLAVAFVLMLLFVVSGTSLVRASSSALPGDSLYSVKRSWENAALFFTFDVEARQQLEVKFENERLEEINDLFASGRPAQVDFAGIVTRQNGNKWSVANLLVMVSNQTKLPDQPVEVGAAVRVTGITSGNGLVFASQIELLSAGASLPDVQVVETEIATETAEVTPQPVNTNPASHDNENDNSFSETATVTPEIEITTTPPPTATPKIEAFQSILNSIGKDVWTIGNTSVNVTNAEIKGIPVVGASVKVEGYIGADGVFVAVKIEVINSGPSNNGNSNGNTNNNTNTNSDDSGSNSNNGNDDSSGGGGSGGGNGNGN